jgi:hypothetical protein
MDYSSFLVFMGNNFLYSFVIIIVSFVLGWLLYNHIVIRGICLKDALFEKDNLAAWVEFIGAFVLPVLYLAAKSIEGSVDENILTDLGTCTLYLIAYILILTCLRLLSNLIVGYMADSDKEGRIRLNNEIYGQKNIAAALFSTALSVAFVNLIRFIDVMPEFFYASLLKASSILIFTLLALIAYSLILKHKTSLFKEIFVDNNIAAGVALLGYVFAVEMILSNAVLLQREFNFPELLLFSLVSMVLFGVLSILFKWLFAKLVRVDIGKEVYEQDNVGAAIGQVALYIGIANVIVHFLM